MAILVTIQETPTRNGQRNMARQKGRNGEPVRLYINAEVRTESDKLAFQRNQSLSDLVEHLLETEIAKAKRNARRRELRELRKQQQAT